MRKGRRQKIKSGAEYDILGSWKRFYCYLARPGVKKSIKRAMNRRWRKELNRLSGEE